MAYETTCQATPAAAALASNSFLGDVRIVHAAELRNDALKALPQLVGQGRLQGGGGRRREPDAAKLHALHPMPDLEFVPQEGNQARIETPGLPGNRREHGRRLGSISNAGGGGKGLLLFLGGTLPGSFVQNGKLLLHIEESIAQKQASLAGRLPTDSL
jgi:hypothetical protein